MPKCGIGWEKLSQTKPMRRSPECDKNDDTKRFLTFANPGCATTRRIQETLLIWGGPPLSRHQSSLILQHVDMWNMFVGAFWSNWYESKFETNNSERPVDALALILEKGESLTHWLSDNFKSRDASASKKTKNGGCENILSGTQLSNTKMKRKPTSQSELLFDFLI